MKKKGIATVAWVLFIMVMVAMSITVVVWSRSRTETVTESTIEYVSGKLECKEVRFSAINNDGSLPCDSHMVNSTNRGTVLIDGFNLRYDFNGEQSEVVELEDPLKPYASKLLNTNQLYTKVEVIPLVKVNDKLIGCKDKKLVVSCP